MGQRDLLILIAQLLAKHKIRYLLTGSFAVSYYGFPRATHDIDFVLEVRNEDFANLLHALESLPNSFLIDKKNIKESVAKSKQFDIYYVDSGIKIDFWPIQDKEFERNKFLRKKTILINKQKVNIISSEDLILTKLSWCKNIRSERHINDCVGIIKVQGDSLDRLYLKEWSEQLEVNDLLNDIYNE